MVNHWAKYLSEEVKESVHQGHSLYKKRMKATHSKSVEPFELHLQDHELLCGLLMANRPFSYIDGLFKELGINPGKLQAFIKNKRELLGFNANGNVHTNVLVDLQKALPAENDKFGATELLTALCKSPDPIVNAAFNEFELTPARVSNAHQSLQKPQFIGLAKKHFNNALFLGRELLEVAFVVVISLIVIKEGFGELRLIPSESMVPTLQIGDRLVIEKVSRWPVAGIERDYRPGDVLVFYPPEPDAVIYKDPLSWFMRSTGFSSLFHNTAADPVDKAFIKRLVATEGQTIWVVPGDGVYIDGEKSDEPYINEIALTCGDFCFPRTVPEGHYFMMGDNRNHSKDSRYFGFQPKDRVVGRAVFRILPINRIGTLD